MLPLQTPPPAAAPAPAPTAPPGIEGRHPSAYVELAATRLKAGRSDEAVFWFYLGQLRWRFELAARPDPDPSGGPALFASMMDVMGGPVNQYAFGDIPKLVATLDAVLAWDAAHPNGFTSKTRYAAAYARQREGLQGLRDETWRTREEIARTRTQNGLENRVR